MGQVVNPTFSMSKLSPAAHAIWNAFLDRYEWNATTEELFAVAAALRAAADQSENLYDPHEGKVSVVRVGHLIAIADELEAQ